MSNDPTNKREEEEAIVDTTTTATGGIENENENENENDVPQEQPEEPQGTEGVEEQSQVEQQQEHKQQEEEEKKDREQLAATASGEAVAPSPEKFVNNGLARWLAARQTWCGNGKAAAVATRARKAVPIDVDGVIDVLFDPRWRGGGRIRVSLEPPRFPTNVPLPQMIDVLTDLWEAEGLDV